MRADDDVHAALPELFDDTLLLAARAKPRQQLDAHRIIRHAFAKRIEVLLREHSGRHQHRHLLAAHDCFERGADRDFGFAIAHVAANQPVHRLGRFHVALRVHDGAHLVRRFFIHERAFKLALPRIVLRVRVARL